MQLLRIVAFFSSCNLIGAVFNEQLNSGDVVGKGPHHRIIQWVGAAVDETGQALTVTNQYTEIATGLMHLDEKGEYVESSPELELSQDGAVGRNTGHQVVFAAEINSQGAVRLTTPDSQQLISSPAGISYYDSSSGRSVLIASVTNSIGELLPSKQEVLYRSAYDGIQADVWYVNSLAGIEANVILREAPPSPSEFGLNDKSTRLEILTEWFQPPSPEKQSHPLGNDSTDESLDFGAFKIASGSAFAISNTIASAPVAKQWTVMEGRQFLIESVDYDVISEYLQSIPKTDVAKINLTQRKRQLVQGHITPPGSLARSGSKPINLAANRLPARGVVIDWTASATSTNYTFKGDTTYYVSGPITMSGTNTTFEGGTVIKFARTNAPKLTVTSPITWLGTPYRPVILSGSDDNSVGDVITGSTGNVLTNYYADVALNIDAVTANASCTLQNLRVIGARTAVALNGKNGHVISHAQLVNCQKGFDLTTTDLALRNALLQNVQTNFAGTTATGICEHVTVDAANYLNGGITSLCLTNCLFVGVTNFGTINSNYCAATSAADVFQSAGQGSHYLNVNSPYRDAGTTEVTPTLLSDIRKTTTYPPVLQSNDFTVDTVLLPQARRDADLPDLGYHYDPLDFCWTSINLTNSTLVLTNGTAIGVYGSRGLYLRGGANFISEGNPITVNRIVRYQGVQEQPVVWGTSPTTLFEIPSTYTPRPTLQMRFTDVSILAGGTSSGGTHQLLPWASGNPLSLLSIVDSSMRDVALLYYPVDTATVTIAVTNNAFERCYLDFEKSYNAQDTPFNLYLRNNLLWNGNCVLYYVVGTHNNPSWEVHDNSFESVSLSQNDPLGHILKSYNGYVNTTSLGGTGNIVLTNFSHATGILGPWYQASTNYINRGSRNATNAGLYHYTTQISQTKEADSVVDIGFHYVALTDPRSNLVAYLRMDESSGSTAADDTGNGHSGTLTGSPPWVPGKRGNALSFDGSIQNGTVADATDLRLTGDLTVAVWVKRQAIPGSWGVVCVKGSNSTLKRNYGLWISSAGDLLFQQYSSPNIMQLIGDKTLEQGVWHHLAGVISSGTGHLYLDGSLIGTASALSPGPTSTDPIQMGTFDGSYFFAGSLDDLRIYSRALSPSEIAGLAGDGLSDSDGDSIPDYFEDRNGNGTIETGEGDWTTYNSPNSLSGNTGLEVFTPLK